MMFTLAIDSAWSGVRRGLHVPLLVCAGFFIGEAKAGPAAWFPESPHIRNYAWAYEPCAGCVELAARPAWRRMAALAGVPEVRFVSAPDDSNGEAYSAAPNVVVLSPSAQTLDGCQLAFVIGHEIVHIAQRHFDEDAVALSVFSGRPADWTDKGEDAIQLTDGDFGLALRVSHLWQAQEIEADWMGALLAAQGSGCSIESSALSYLRLDSEAGGGMATTHAPNLERVRRLLPFTESAQRLADSVPGRSGVSLADLQIHP